MGNIFFQLSQKRSKIDATYVYFEFDVTYGAPNGIINF